MVGDQANQLRKDGTEQSPIKFRTRVFLIELQGRDEAHAPCVLGRGFAWGAQPLFGGDR